MNAPEFDVVVFGASSFVGKLLCAYLNERYGAAGGLKWAAAARSQAKLEALRGELGPAAAAARADRRRRRPTRPRCARCACARAWSSSTVGPYALYGEPLVRVCAQTGTDYCDLTGEVQWIRRMIERYEAAAHASPARASCTAAASTRSPRTSACISCSRRPAALRRALHAA